jgi:chain length determinant protein EpsF
MNFTQFLSILRARWLVALVVLVVAVATATLVTLFLLTKRYTATASVLVDAKPDPVAGVLYPGAKSTAFVATQVDVIKSERVARRVLRNLRLTESPATREQWLASTGGEGTIEQWLIELYATSLEVLPSTDSNVIYVRFTSSTPASAAQLANAFVDAYLQTTLELRIDPARQYTAFFEKQLKDARDAVEKAQVRFSAFQREKGLIATDERLDIENARLNELSTQLVGLQLLAAESGSRQAQVGTSGDRMQESLSNPVVSNLRAELAKSEVRMQELNARYGKKHPQVLELQASIAELRSRLDAETKRASGSVAVTATINRQREREIRAALEAQRTKVLQLKSVRDDATVLIRDLENAQRSYDALFAKANQVELERDNTTSNIYKLTEAVAPVKPSSPIIALNVALSVVLGAMLALGTVLLLELMDRRIRTFDDLTAGLGLAVLGNLPRPDSKRLAGSARALKMERAVLGHTPLVGRGA